MKSATNKQIFISLVLSNGECFALKIESKIESHPEDWTLRHSLDITQHILSLNLTKHDRSLPKHYYMALCLFCVIQRCNKA